MTKGEVSAGIVEHSGIQQLCTRGQGSQVFAGLGGSDRGGGGTFCFSSRGAEGEFNLQVDRIVILIFLSKAKQTKIICAK